MSLLDLFKINIQLLNIWENENLNEDIRQLAKEYLLNHADSSDKRELIDSINNDK